MAKNYDFSGWATKHDLLCSDGLTIKRDAFKDDNGVVVPLVWNHCHNDPSNVLGHATLESRADGVYAHCSFNDSEAGQNAKTLVGHGDVRSLSIYANKLKKQGNNVVHGNIREVSLVLAGANPGAFIDNIITHGESSEEISMIMCYDENAMLIHSDDSKKGVVKMDDKDEKKPKPETDSEETLGEIFDTLSEKQKNVVYALVGQALEDQNDDEDNNDDSKGGNKMKHNVFENDEKEKDVLAHSEMADIINDAKRYGSLKDSVIAHGITDIEYLFPEAKTVNNVPSFISRDTGWVAKVMAAVHKTPFSRIKSTFANITEEDARAKGYIKGKLKKEEVFSLLKRTTTPTTVYKKQKLDRDDVVDITDFDVVAWLKAEMRGMLDEELTRAFLVGDGRLNSSDDKINESNIRPIWNDSELYTIKSVFQVAKNDPDEKLLPKAFIKAAIRSRKEYKGSGSPVLYATEDIITECLLLEDTTGRIIYDSIDKLATSLRVKEIITVPVLEGVYYVNSESKECHLQGIIVNLNDYNVGADKGGAINMFDDFDIDYNAQKYLIETRCSGALIKPYSAIALIWEQV